MNARIYIYIPEEKERIETTTINNKEIQDITSYKKWNLIHIVCVRKTKRTMLIESMKSDREMFEAFDN